MHHIWRNFNKDAHTSESNAILINKTENMQETFIQTKSYFNRKNSQERKRNF